MKKFLALILIQALCLLSGAAFAQSITDGSYRTIGFIKSNGTIQDASYKTIGFIKSDGTVQDGSYRTIGHIRKDGTVQHHTALLASSRVTGPSRTTHTE